ncbi:MAG: phosphoserine phosphatase SerB [Succinivibrio sp.]|jgi:phosphoserine phosphatase|nr:phosphoserine phosphatase SerB [Succinivibrio sp.]
MSLLFVSSSKQGFDPENSARAFAAAHGLELSKCRQGVKGANSGAIFECRGSLDRETLQAVNLGKAGFDLLFAKAFPSLSAPGVLALDMDMTSVQIEGIDEIARRLGVFDKVAAITSEAMHGKLEFAQSLRRRVAMLEGGDASVIEEVKKIMRETDGLSDLMEATARAHWARGICSGGFVQLICVLERKYALEAVHANSLEIKDGRLTGKVDRAIVDGEAKRQGVISMMRDKGVARSQCVVLGDGANDLKMIGEAGLGIAYHAKEPVRLQAPFALNHSDLGAVALLLELNAER